MLTKYQQKTIEVITHYSSKKEKITAREIAKKIGLKIYKSDGFNKGLSNMQEIIHNLRVKGYPICADRGGYFLTKDKAVLENYIRSLKGRCEKIQLAINGLKYASNSTKTKKRTK